MITTSKRNPTEHAKYLQDALFEWCLVVVGDTKSSADWKYKDAVFLSIQDDISKRYRVVNKILPDSYLRKMVGYLYAIEHGAKYIYETDDDKSPLDGLLGFKYEQYRGLEIENKEEGKIMFVNPYAYFGQPSMWPRGYPLEMISSETSVNCSKFSVSTKMPLIQQGLINGDPDVDAVYRYVLFVVFCLKLQKR